MPLSQMHVQSQQQQQVGGEQAVMLTKYCLSRESLHSDRDRFVVFPCDFHVNGERVSK